MTRVGVVSAILGLAAGSLAFGQQPYLDSGVYDFTNVCAQYAAARAADQIAWSDFNMTVIRLERAFHASPQYQAAVQEVDDAYAGLQSAEQPVLEMVERDPHYQEIAAKRTNVSLVMLQDDLPRKDFIDLATSKMEYGTQMRQMERAALAGDAGVQRARQRLVAAQRALDDLSNNFADTLYQNPQWMAAKEAYNRAEVACAGADGAVWGAGLTSCLAVEADARHSAYAGDYSAAGFGGSSAYPYGYGYFGRRY